MTKETLIEVIEKLCGSCFPYGDHNIDKERAESLELKKYIVVALLKDIEEASRFKHRPEWSIQEIAKNACVFLVETKDWVDQIVGTDDESISNFRD